MKKIYSLILIVFSFVCLNAQTTILFEENFDDTTAWQAFPATGWTSLDIDDDSNQWYFDVYEADGYVLSRSWLDPDPLTPDNWLITPAIDASNVTINDSLILTFTTCPTANDNVYRDEHYGVFVSNGTTDTADFDMVFDETFPQSMENWVFVSRRVDLGTYIGDTIYVAFRHWNSTDNDRIAINDVVVSKMTPGSINQTNSSNISVYPNPASQYINILSYSNSKVEIYNNVGQIVLTQTIQNNAQISVNNLVNGVYTVKVTSGNDVKNQKIIINR